MGRFITFEGTEGAGKTTQIQKLAERFRQHGFTVTLCREPGGTPLGEEIRNLLKHSKAGDGMSPETELLLMNAARAELVRQVIRPALERKEIVISDRFLDSSLAYQGFGRGLPIPQVRTIIDFAVGGLRPHLTLLLRIPLDVSEERRRSRNENPDGATDRFEKSGREFFHRVEEGFEKLAAWESDRIRVIDATRSMDEVHAEIWKAVQGIVGK